MIREVDGDTPARRIIRKVEFKDEGGTTEDNVREMNEEGLFGTMERGGFDFMVSAIKSGYKKLQED